MLNALRRLLTRRGFDVEIASGGRAALESLEAAPSDVVITDFKMPGMSGVELMASVRAHNQDTLFILMTAYGTVENAVEAMKQGAYDYLPKPLDMKRLRALVQKSLEFQAVVAENHELRLRLQTRSDSNLPPPSGGIPGRPPHSHRSG